MENTGNYFLIKHLTLLTGLTDRTIRSHINAGFLQGEKIDGLWHFTPEQVEAFLHHPAVRPGIVAKNNALVYDFLADVKKKAREACVVLDLPDADPKATAEFFCYLISTGDFHNINFAFDSVLPVPRVILKGDAAAVLRLVNEFEQSGGTIDN